MQQFEVRDGRKKEMFRVDDEYLNGYAKLCGSNATMVYLCLCRHADRNQESFPSVETMAEKTGISRDSVMRGLKKLIEWNIISKSRERREDAKWLNNRYTLLDKSVWVPKPSSGEQHGLAKSQNEASQVANGGVSQVAHSDTKDTHIKVTHTKGAAQSAAGKFSPLGAEVVKAFASFNVAAARYYANTTQRGACDRLIEAHGLEKVLRVVAILPQTNGMQYMPTITTPLQLEERWASLESQLRKKKSEHTERAEKFKVAFH